MDAHLQDLFAEQEGMKLFIREVREEFGVRLLATGDWTPFKESSCPYRFGIARLDEEGDSQHGEQCAGLVAQDGSEGYSQ